MLVIAKRPDRDPQTVLAFSECRDRRVAVAEMAHDVSGRKGDVPAAPFDQKVGRMVGDFGDVAAKVDSGDIWPAIRSSRRRRVSQSRHSASWSIARNRSTAASRPMISSLPTFIPRPMPISGLIACRPAAIRSARPSRSPEPAGLAGPCHRRRRPGRSPGEHTPKAGRQGEDRRRRR